MGFDESVLIIATTASAAAADPASEGHCVIVSDLDGDISSRVDDHVEVGRS
jgi:hypothetical protein